MIQFIEYSEKGDKTLYSMHSSLLKEAAKFSAKCNTPTAYLAGLYAGKQAKAKGVKKAIADISGTASRGAVVFAAIKGAIDAGVEIPLDQEKIVAERLDGSHLNLKKEFDAAKKAILS
ncbi:50S ribosomal protein L18 [uncultured archaeon]|nr:50S ribosomal protein L18 [uncultured archaeon]